MDATIEKLNINWSVFSDDEARIIQKGVENGAYEQLIAMISSVTPEKADEIAKIQAEMRPRAFVFESRAQKEFEIWMKDHPGAITPAIEAEWQSKIDAERNIALERMKNEAPISVREVQPAQVKTSVAHGQEGSNLSGVSGLGEASVNKLNAAGIFTIEELKLRPHADLIKILNPLVAATVKKFFNQADAK